MLRMGMGKRIYWVLVAFVTICGMSTLVYFAIQPKPVQKIKLSSFESPAALADLLLAQFREEIIQSPILLLGVETENPESIEIWNQFLLHNKDPQMSYDVVVADQFLNDSEQFKDAQILDTKEDSDSLLEGLKSLMDEGKRVVIVLPVVYSAQMIPGNVANKIKLKFPQVMSLSMSEFPRSRAAEKKMPRACIVAGVDTSGIGPFACVVVQTARAQYLKRFKPGQRIGLANQIGLKDYLVLYTTETQ